MLPRVLIVSRRTLRKNKFVDFVGEYHLELIVGCGAVPVIVPRVAGVNRVLKSFEPIHGVLLCEGEDIDPSLYASSNLPPQEVDEIKRLHSDDTAIDREKDSIELTLTRICLDRNIPLLGICRGSQILNVACGGTLYQDIEKELSSSSPNPTLTTHIDYDNYDGHRHVVEVVENTPLHTWFNQTLGSTMKMRVNSYHHQGVKKLADRFVKMAAAPDGVVEGFYDPDCYNPREGRFLVGLQFHPERMRRPHSLNFDYPACPRPYQEFVEAVVAYQKKTMGWRRGLKSEEESKRREVVDARHEKSSSSSSTQMVQDDDGLLEWSNTASECRRRGRRRRWLKKRRGEEKKEQDRVMIGKMTEEEIYNILCFHVAEEALERELKGV